MFCTKHRHRKQLVTKPNPVVDPSGWNGGWDGVTPPSSNKLSIHALLNF